jgi:hypothetical protein
MKTDEIINLTDAYFASKTTPDEERLLFSSLAQDLEGRNYFKDSMLLKTALQTIEEPFPEHLDEKILKELQVTGKKESVNEYLHPRFLPFYAITVCVIIFTFIFFNKMESYKSEMDKAMQTVKDQQYTIELLMNGLPTVQVRPTSGQVYKLMNN